MQIFYTNLKTKGIDGVTAHQRDAMKDAIIDYGALHHTPVRENARLPPPIVHQEVRTACFLNDSDLMFSRIVNLPYPPSLILCQLRNL
jgi:hypothetical protein